MLSLDDGRNQLALYQKKSNNIIKTCLGMLLPNQVLKKYLSVMFLLHIIDALTGSLIYQHKTHLQKLLLYVTFPAKIK